VKGAWHYAAGGEGALVDQLAFDALSKPEASRLALRATDNVDDRCDDLSRDSAFYPTPQSPGQHRNRRMGPLDRGDDVCGAPVAGPAPG
jgi:hypothetical protein